MACALLCDSLVTVHILRALLHLCATLRIPASFVLITRIIYCVTLHICCEVFMQAVSLLRGCGDHCAVSTLCEGNMLRRLLPALLVCISLLPQTQAPSGKCCLP